MTEAVHAPVSPPERPSVRFAHPTAPAVVAQTPAIPPDRRRMLLVEDHPDTAWVLHRVLTAAGFEVATAPNVNAALLLAEQRQGGFDLLISDVGLPDGTGWDLMRRLHGRWGIPGIAVSGFSTDDDIRRSREAGFQEHLVKPLTLDCLEAAIERALRSPASAKC